jgi:ABC-type lipoprotein export system ATPase subunit
MRNKIQERLALSQSIASNPNTVFCVEPFNSLSNDNSERLGKLLMRVMNNPDHAMLVATQEAFVFAFADRVAGGESEAGAQTSN